jgi:hypothetical protein
MSPAEVGDEVDEEYRSPSLYSGGVAPGESSGGSSYAPSADGRGITT